MRNLKRLFALIAVFVFGASQLPAAMSNGLEKNSSDKQDNAISVSQNINHLTDDLSQHLC